MGSLVAVEAPYNGPLGDPKQPRDRAKIPLMDNPEPFDGPSARGIFISGDPVLLAVRVHKGLSRQCYHG